MIMNSDYWWYWWIWVLLNKGLCITCCLSLCKGTLLFTFRFICVCVWSKNASLDLHSHPVSSILQGHYYLLWTCALLDPALLWTFYKLLFGLIYLLLSSSITILSVMLIDSVFLTQSSISTNTPCWLFHEKQSTGSSLALMVSLCWVVISKSLTCSYWLLCLITLKTFVVWHHIDHALGFDNHTLIGKTISYFSNNSIDCTVACILNSVRLFLKFWLLFSCTIYLYCITLYTLII